MKLIKNVSMKWILCIPFFLFITVITISCSKDNDAPVEEMAEEDPADDPDPDPVNQTLPIPIANCKIPRATSSLIGIGIPKTQGLLPSIGTVKMTVLIVGFPDVPITQTPQEIFDIVNPIAGNYFNETSYGRMQLNLEPHLEWLPLSEPSAYYAGALDSGVGHLAFIQEAVDLADPLVDFSQTDIVLVISNPNATALEFGPTFLSNDPNFSIQADGAKIVTGITSGYDLNYWGGIWLPHETGHALSLPDLYSSDPNGQLQYTGTWSLMGDQSGNGKGLFAYERWMLGWLDDTQIFCHGAGEAIVDIQQIETAGGTKAVVVPLSATQALVVESRRKVGFDASLVKEGALVYLVDTAKENQMGPIRVTPGAHQGTLFNEAPLGQNETYTYQNVTVKVLETKANSDVVSVLIN